MTELAIEPADLQPCPTCAAVVRHQDMDEHLRWHATTTSGAATSGSETGEPRPAD